MGKGHSRLWFARRGPEPDRRGVGQRGTGGRLSDSVAGIGDMWCRSRNRLPRWSAAAGVVERPDFCRRGPCFAFYGLRRIAGILLLLQSVPGGFRWTSQRWLRFITISWSPACPRALCLAFVAAGREAWQGPLFRVAAAWGILALSRRTGFVGPAGQLGYEFEVSLFGVARLERGRFAVS